MRTTTRFICVFWIRTSANTLSPFHPIHHVRTFGKDRPRVYAPGNAHIMLTQHADRAHNAYIGLPR
jgi:hypothetical protein